MTMLNENSELTWLGRMVWLAGAVIVGLASQYCINFGSCAAPL